MRDTTTELTIAARSELATSPEWNAVQVWLEGVRLNGGDYSDETATTYGYHVAKLRWYCERNGLPLTRWTQADANEFVAFLRNPPNDALCRKIDTGRTRRQDDGSEKPVMRFARPDEPGYTPLRIAPSKSSREDIIRCVRALFEQLHDDGVIRRNPMAKVKIRKSRQINVERSLNLDMYAYVLEYLDASACKDEFEARLRARDRFAFVALRELGLRASELVGVRMRDIYPLTDTRDARTYWVLRVDAEHAKGSVTRDVPMTRAVFEELMAYRTMFGLPALPETNEDYGLLLSVQTKAVVIGSRAVKEPKSRRYFRAWASITSRKSLYLIVKTRLDEVAASLAAQGREAEARNLREVSPHWLRHTFAKALIMRGRDIRVVAESLGHASVTTTMAYTKQSAIDQIREYSKDGDHDLATQAPPHVA